MVLLHSQKLPMGWEAPNFRLMSTQYRYYTLADFKDKPGLLIIFTCNHCPYARASWPLLNDLYGLFKGEVFFAAVNPNDPESYPEDSFDDMKRRKKDWNIVFPYLVDETQQTAKLYEAQCTPDPYLFRNEEGKWKLFYHGRVNDNWQSPEEVKERNLEDALKSLLAGSRPPLNQPPAMGCSIKWKRR